MLDVLQRWYQRQFSDPRTVTLFLLLLTIFAVIYFFGSQIMPVLVALVVAYVLEWPVAHMERIGIKRVWGTTFVITIFVGVLSLVVLAGLPTVMRQGDTLSKELPNMISSIQAFLNTLPERYPDLIDTQVIDSLGEGLRRQLQLSSLSSSLFDATRNSFATVMTWLVYLILVPLLTFFFLKDKSLLINSIRRFLPKNRQLANQVWSEMNQQIMNYIRGKVIEILIVGGVSYITFALMGLRYSALLGVLVGLSVLIPYIGAAVVTIPVALVGFFQWGWSEQFGYLMLAYGIIQALDGNVLVPVLFSEAVNLHPVAIIISVLVFGGLWGFWGVFFAIPLATLVKAVINAWPRFDDLDAPSSEPKA